MYALRYLQASTLLFSALTIALNYCYDLPLALSLRIVSSVFGYLMLGLYGSILFYRLYWHPLRAFPGPFAAKISSLWFSVHVRASHAHQKALGLYIKYGQFVRVGSSDLMIAHPSSVPAVHGLPSKCYKGSWYDEDRPRQSIHTSRDHSFHGERRRLWSQSFNDKALRGYERRIAVYNKALIDRLGENSGHTINAAKWFDYYSYDVMGDLAFGQDFGMLRSGEQHFAVELLKEALSVQGFKLPTWFFRILVAIPSLTKQYWAFIQYCDERLVAKMAQGKSNEPSLMNVLLARAGPKPSPQNLLTLQSDCRTIIVAGSDTVPASLSHIFYLLTKHPKHVVTLRQELLPLMNSNGTVEHQKIERAVHLNAVISYIPGNMNVWTPQYVISRSGDAYERPFEFIPEWWYSAPSMIKESAGYAPFSTGPYACIGHPLALMEMRLVIADDVSRFDFEFPEGKDGSDFIKQTKDHFVWREADLDICFRARGSHS